MLEVGFTGTQQELTEVQLETLCKLLIYLRDQCAVGGLHHGDCIGADRAAHTIARALAYYITIHPPLNSTKRAFCIGNYYHPKKAHLQRNRNIVDYTEALIGCPRTETEELRSGTWSTVRYARKLGRPIFLVMPDGRVMTERLESSPFEKIDLT